MRHKHLCKSCGVVWEHDQRDFDSSEEFAKAHDCPNCAVHETWKYWGDKAPDYCHKKGIGNIYCVRVNNAV